MTTSGSVDFNMTRNQIIFDAFKKLGILAEGEDLTGEMLQGASRDLNRLVKAWQAQGIHLWGYQEITLFLEKGKESYVLGPNGDNATASFVQTTLATDAAVLATSIDVADATGISDGDFISVKLDTNELFWTKVSGAPAGNTITLATGIPSEATSGNPVFAYTKKTDRPARIQGARRRDDESAALPSDIPMLEIARETYFNLPNKLTQGLPTQYYYDRQLVDGVLFLWTNPDNDLTTIKLTIERPLQDFDDPLNTADFPQEWLMPLVYNLAALLAPEYGVPLEDRRELKIEANAILELAKGFDQENGSIFIQPGSEPTEGWD